MRFVTTARSGQKLAAVAVLAGALLSVAVPATALTPAAASSETAPSARAAAAYPYARSNPDGVDPWGDYYRQCTSYAAWWLTTHGLAIASNGKLRGPEGWVRLGDAKNWDRAAHQAGYAVSSKPVVGAIAQWRADERTSVAIRHGTLYFQAGSAGHVAVVRKVYADGSALIEDYNGAVPLGLHSYRGRAPRYLLIHS